MLHYTISTIDSNSIHSLPCDEKIINRYFYVNPIILSRLVECQEMKNRIIDVGGGTMDHFPLASHIIDMDTTKENVYKVDIDFEKLPFNDEFFTFAYCRHTLEDIQNPQFAFTELTRVAVKGYIETPSPLIEILKNVTSDQNEEAGYLHHRYIVWSDPDQNVLYFLPKYGMIEYVQSSDYIKRLTHIVNNYPVYWNNYYYWDENNPPKVFLYRHGMNFNIMTDYSSLVTKAILSSIQYAEKFLTHIGL